MNEKKQKAVLIDGHSILNRAFYGVPDLTNSEGLHTNAVYGFLNIMFRILENEQPDYLTVAFDVHAPTFRHKMYDAYKGTRKPMAEELRQQVPVIKELLKAMGVCVVEMEGYEADDLLGTMARIYEEEGVEAAIVSGDRDLLQLATKMTKIIIPKTKKNGTEIEVYYESDVLEHYHVTPEEFIDVKALMGDTSDNIPGVPGIGEKGATNLIAEFKSIENAYAHIDDIRQKRVKEALQEHYDLARMSKELAAIDIHAPIEYDRKAAELGNLFTKEAYVIVKKLEFKNILNRFETDVVTNPVKDVMEIAHTKEQAELFARQQKPGERLALYVVAASKQVYGCGVCMGEKQLCYFSCGEGFLLQEMSEVIVQMVFNAARISCMDVKAVLHSFGLNVDRKERAKFFDAEVAAYLLNPLKGSYPFDELASEYTGMMLPAKEDLFGKLNLQKAKDEMPQKLAEYGCAGAYAAYILEQKLKEALEETGQHSLYDEIEQPLIFTLYHMEKEGILVKQQELEQYGQRLNVRIVELEQEIYQECGETFNINSPKQLGVILFEKLGLPNGKKTKTGYSTAADILEKLAAEYPIVNKILEYRQLTKLKSTYADGLSAYIGADNRIHSTFNQTVTATGRLSSTEPNLQNIPIRMELGRLIRKVFVPKEGFVFVDADYSQIELRVLAHMSGDETLIEAYKQAQDIHRMTASQVFHTPFEQVTDLQRRNAKAVNFGIVYGISSFGLSQDLSITKKEAQEYIEQYFKTYPKVKQFLDCLVSGARERGYVETLFGRRRPVPELSSGNFMQRSFGERIAMNSPIQGTAADIIKIAMNKVADRLEQEGLRSRLILQVHDELLVETAEEETEQVLGILEEEMESAADLAVKLEIDAHVGSNWFEAK